MNKKIKQNKYKPEAGKSREARRELITSAEAVDFCLKCIMIVVSITVLSLASIFIYDFITQTDFFNIKTIEISGTKQTSKNVFQIKYIFIPLQTLKSFRRWRIVRWCNWQHV